MRISHLLTGFAFPTGRDIYEIETTNLQPSLYCRLTTANLQTRDTCPGFLGIPIAFTEPGSHFTSGTIHLQDWITVR